MNKLQDWISSSFDELSYLIKKPEIINNFTNFISNYNKFYHNDKNIRKELTPYCFDVVEMDTSPFNKKFACSLATCPHRVAKLYLATKSVTQKEDEQVKQNNDQKDGDV